MAAERDPYLVLQVSRRESWPAIRAAYRTLARQFHADGTTPDRERMVEINTAYARLEREHRRIDDPISPGVAVGPGPRIDGAFTASSTPAPPSSGSLLRRMMSAKRLDTPVVDFGQYAGWRIAEIAEHDPRYLRWLSRHSAGHRYRAVIEQVLGSDPEIGRRAALVR